jgi:NitT/TauT family transport system substrate-binding protein
MKNSFLKIFTITIIVVNILASLEANTIKIAVLKFGSVNWELNVIKHHKLDKKHNIRIKKIEMTNKDASTIAFLSKSVDIFVTDWIWVSKQRSQGNYVSFIPYSNSAGGLMIKKNKKIYNFLDLKDRKVGVAGGSLDKSWLFLRAYAIKKYEVDPLTFFKTSFAAPPLINGLLRNNQLDAGFNYWNYSARLKAQGYEEFLKLDEILPYIGINGELPLIGYVFRDSFVKENYSILNKFIKTSNEAREILKTSDKEWNRINKITGANDELMLKSIRDGFRKGIPSNNHKLMRNNIENAYKILSKIGGNDLVGNSTKLTTGTYWEKIE